MKHRKGYIKKFISRINWIDNYLTIKYNHIFYRSKYRTFSMLVDLIFIGSYLFILNTLGILEIENDILKYNNLDYKDFYNDLVIVQISCTFLTTAIISLISNIETKYVYGEKLTNRVFDKKSSNFYSDFIILNFLMILNIILMIKQTGASALVGAFLLSIYLLIDVIAKIGRLFLSTKRERELLFYDYYIENKNIVVNGLPFNQYNYALLNNLREVTFKLILDKDISYMENIQIYQAIINKTFYNHRKEIQDFYLFGRGKSVLNDFLDIIDMLISTNEINRAIQQFTWFLDRLDYFNVYINSFKIMNLSNQLMDKLVNLKDEYEVKEYLRKISDIVYGIERQRYFGMVNDFSTIEKIKKYILYSNKEANYFKRIYENICNNKNLTDIEKKNCYLPMFDLFRMSKFECEDNIEDITSYSFNYKLPKERKMPICILGQACMYLFLSMMKNKDEDGLKLFLKMNIGENDIYFAIHAMILSLLKMEITEADKNLYSEFCGIDFNWCKEFISNHFDLLFKRKEEKIYINYCKIIEHLPELYQYMIEQCVSTEDGMEGKKQFIMYLCRYEKKLIDKYFAYLCNVFQIKIEGLKFYPNDELKDIFEGILPALVINNE